MTNGFYWMHLNGEWSIVEIRDGEVWMIGGEVPNSVEKMLMDAKFVGPIDPPKPADMATRIG